MDIKEILNFGNETEAPEGTEAPEVKAEGTEAKPEGTEAKAEAKDENNFEARFADLAKKEAALREKEEALKSNEEKINKFTDIETKLKENPREVFKALGMEENDLIMKLIETDADGQEEEEVDLSTLSVEEQLEYLRNEIKSEKERKVKELEEQKIKEEQDKLTKKEESIKKYKTNITEHINDEANGKKYELIKLQNAEDLIWKVTNEHFNKTQEVLPIEVAAGKVEGYLKAQVEKALATGIFGNLKKEDKNISDEVFKKMEEKVTLGPTAKLPEVKTLTNKLTNEPNTKKDIGNTLSESDSLARAASFLRWKK